MTCNFLCRTLFYFVILALAACGKEFAGPQGQIPGNATQVEVSSDAQAIYAYLSYREYLQEQKIAEAIASLEHAIALEPTQELYLDLANLYWSTGNMGKAAEITKEALEHSPRSVPLLTALVKIYTAQGRHQDAETTLDEYVKQQPEQIHIIQEYALYLIEQGQYAQALDRLTTVPKDSVNARTDLLLGKACAGLELYDKAVKHFLLAIQEDEGNYEAWVNLALTYEAQKNYVAAVQIFSQLIDFGLDSQEILFQLVDLNLKLNNPDRALSYVAEHTDDELLVLESANLMLNQEFYDHAAHLLDPLAWQSSIPPNALFYLARLEFEGRDNPVGALSYLEAIPTDHDLYERSLIFRIHLLYQNEEKEEAKKLCLDAQKLFPDQPEFMIIYADLLEFDNEFMASLDVLLAAKHRWPKSTSILYRLGLLYDKLEHKEKTVLTMEQIIGLDPEHANALNYLGYTFAEQGINLERAEILVTNALRIDPDNGYYIDSLAWIYFKQGRLQQAWKEIRRAVQFVTDPVIWEHYGDIARSINLFQESKKGYLQAVAVEGENKASVLEKLHALDQQP